jgi:hypothetical protein
MNASLALALLSLFLLLFSRLLDWKLERIDLPVFKNQLANDETLGIKDWFTSTSGNKIGEGRTLIVLRMATFSASARASLASMLTAACGLGLSWFIIATDNPVPPLYEIRVWSAAVTCILLLAAALALFAMLIRGILEPVPVHSADEKVLLLLRDWMRRHRHLRFLTPYVTLVFAANAVAVVVAVGI